MANACALVIDLDYTYAGTFFAVHPDAKTALEKAASDVQGAITTSFTAVPNDTYVGAFGFDPSQPTIVTFNWDYSFSNPSNSAATVNVDTFSFAANHFKIYVGAEALPPTSIELGQGGGVELTLGTGVQDAVGSEIKQAVNLATTASNNGMSRGGAPAMALVNDAVTIEGVTANYALKVGPLAGTLSMNAAANWHFDINTPPSAGESDFYSVALHEILHTLGVGTSETWDSLVNGANWSGSNVISLVGTGNGLIDQFYNDGTPQQTPDGAHIAEGAMSTSIMTGLPQEAVMDPSLTTGTRKTLTALDLAFLRDLGYTTVAVPEPGTLVLLGVAALGLLALRRRRA